MRLKFRQGIIRTDNQYLQPNGNGVDLIPNQPLEVTIADRSVNYYHVEPKPVLNAWSIAPEDYLTTNYLYIDIDIRTGIRTFGYSPYTPAYGSQRPVNPQVNQYWFNNIEMTSNYFNGQSYVKVNRVFVGTYNQNTVQYLPIGSHVGSQSQTNTYLTGAILYDMGGKALSDSNKQFVTTESTLNVSGAYNYSLRLDSSVHKVRAEDTFSASTVVKYTEFGEVEIAHASDLNNFMLAIAMEDASPGYVITVIHSGEVINEAWNYPTVGEKIYLDNNGQLITRHDVPASSIALQQPHIGRVIEHDRILFKPTN